MADHLLSAFVDRIEDGKFAVILTEDERELVVPVEDVPIELESGTWIRIEEQEGRLVSVIYDQEKQNEMRRSVSDKMERLRKRGRRSH